MFQDGGFRHALQQRVGRHSRPRGQIRLAHHGCAEELVAAAVVGVKVGVDHRDGEGSQPGDRLFEIDFAVARVDEQRPFAADDEVAPDPEFFGYPVNARLYLFDFGHVVLRAGMSAPSFYTPARRIAMRKRKRHPGEGAVPRKKKRESIKLLPPQRGGYG